MQLELVDLVSRFPTHKVDSLGINLLRPFKKISAVGIVIIAFYLSTEYIQDSRSHCLDVLKFSREELSG